MISNLFWLPKPQRNAITFGPSSEIVFDPGELTITVGEALDSDYSTPADVTFEYDYDYNQASATHFALYINGELQTFMNAEDLVVDLDALEASYSSYYTGEETEEHPDTVGYGRTLVAGA